MEDRKKREKEVLLYVRWYDGSIGGDLFFFRIS